MVIEGGYPEGTILSYEHLRKAFEYLTDESPRYLDPCLLSWSYISVLATDAFSVVEFRKKRWWVRVWQALRNQV